MRIIVKTRVELIHRTILEEFKAFCHDNGIEIETDACPNSLTVALINLGLSRDVISDVHLPIDRPTREQLGEDGYAILVNNDDRKQFTIVSYVDRGLVYGMFSLFEHFEDHGSFDALKTVIRRPQFPVRAWSSKVLWPMPTEGRSLQDHLDAANRLIRDAARRGVNIVTFEGRWGDMSLTIHIFTNYPSLPDGRINPISNAERERRITCLRKICHYGRRYGMRVGIWDGELIYPLHLLEVAPELKADGRPKGTVCVSHPRLMEFLEQKIEDFFMLVPESDALVVWPYRHRGRKTSDLAIADIYPDGKCQCPRCRDYTPQQAIRDLLEHAYSVCHRHGKQMIVFTFHYTKYDSGDGSNIGAGCPPAANYFVEACRDLPKDIIAEITWCTHDFTSLARIDNPIIDQFNIKRMVEFSTSVEGYGAGILPALYPGLLQEKIRTLAKRGVEGVCVRIDYLY